MEKFTVFGFTLIVMLIISFSGHALIRYEDLHLQRSQEIQITGFLDYPPFGAVEHPNEDIRGKFTTLWQPMIDQFKKENNLSIKVITQKMSYPELVQAVRRGEIDMLLGAYHETALYKGLEFVFPAVIDNPVTIFMLPNRVNEVKEIDDLKKLNGVRSNKEIYSDFVEGKLKEFKLTTLNSNYELFEQLFTKKADYILIGRYYGLIEAYKLGLREQISEAKLPLWNMPLFVGISKVSRHRKLIAQKLTRYAEKAENKKAIEQHLIEMIAQYEKNTQGVVPPTFGLETNSHPQQQEAPVPENSADVGNKK